MRSDSVCSIRSPRRLVLADAVIILVPIIAYALVVYLRFWTHPSASDPVNYLQSVVRRDMTMVSYPTRLMVSLGMFVSDLISRPFIPDAALRVGAFHPMLVNTLCLVIGAVYCYRRCGLAAAVIFNTMLASSYVFLRYSNEAYPDVDLTLYTMLAAVFLTSRCRDNAHFNAITLCGIFCVFVGLTKTSALATLGTVAVYLLIQRRGLRALLVGGALGGMIVVGLSLIAFDFGTVTAFVARLPARLEFVVDAMTNARYGVEVSGYNAVVNLLYFPLLIGLVAFGSFWKYNPARVWFSFAAAHLLLLAVLVGLSQHLRTDNYIYFHTSTTCACVGLALGLGDRLRAYFARADRSTAFVIASRLAALSLFGIVATSFTWGMDYGNYVLAPTGRETPPWFRVVYGVTPLVLLLLMIVINSTRSVIATCCFVVGVAAWCPYSILYVGDGLRQLCARTDRPRDSALVQSSLWRNATGALATDDSDQFDAVGHRDVLLRRRCGRMVSVFGRESGQTGDRTVPAAALDLL